MNIWSQIPFLRFFLPFIIGILTAVYIGLQIAFIDYILLGLFILVSLFVFIKGLNNSYKYSWMFGTLITFLLFLCGFQLTVLNTDKFNMNHFSRFQNAELFYVKTSGTYLEKEKSYKITVNVLAAKQNGKWIETSGNAMCYFKKDSASKNIRYGDCLILKTKFTEIKYPPNPSEFDYKRFLFYHGIYHQAYLPSENWKSLGINDGNKILSACYSIRECLLNIYRENKITGDEFAVGSALVLGYTDKLDQDLINAYASSGALHVLSVSGLHVGIIYIICNYLLLFLDKFKHGKFIKMILLLSALWFYATLTGLSPAVLRSAAMFSFVVIAKTWRYNTNIFNTLAISCFALLMFNPYFIMDVGFQLSYLAVFGIVSIQPWIYEKWQPKTWIVNEIWLIVSVSIAAQLTTFPLGLFYFHQFPNYFLFSNLIVIPVSTIILGYGLLMFVLGKISAIGITCGKIFSFFVWILNESVRITDETPGSLIQGIFPSILETIIIYLLTIFLIVFIFKKQVRYLFISLSTIIVLLSFQTIEAHSVCKQKAIIVYDIPTVSAYDFINGKQTLFLADSSLLHNQSGMKFHIKQNWWNRNVTNQKILENEKENNFSEKDLLVKNNFISFENKRIVIVKELPLHNSVVNQKLKVDILILSKNPKIKIRDLQKWFEFKKIIFDSSNSNWITEKWKKECIDLKIYFYSVIDSGAYIEEL